MLPQTLHRKLQQAFALQQQGKLKQAGAQYRQLLRYAPSHPLLQYGYARLLIEIGEHGEALSLLEAAMPRLPAQAAPDMHRHLADALQGLGRLDEALLHAERSVTHAPGKDSPVHHLQHARLLRQLGCFDRAGQAYRQALLLAPGLHTVWTEVGEMHAAANNHTKACMAYGRALALEPDAAAALTGRAQALAALDQVQAALTDMARALSLSPQQAPVRAGYAKVLYFLGRQREAVREVRSALDLLRQAWTARSKMPPPVNLSAGSGRALLPAHAAEALLDLHTLFMAYEIPYFLVAGTLLGICRDGELLPHDKDLDVGLPWTVCRKRLIEVIESSEHFRLHDPSHRERDDVLAWNFAVMHKTISVGIDFYFFKPEPDGSMLSGLYARPVPLLRRFSAFAIADLPYRGVRLPAPACPEAYFSEIYGPDWRTPDPNFVSAFSAHNLLASCRDVARAFGYLHLYEQFAQHNWVKARAYANSLLAYDDDGWLQELCVWLESYAVGGGGVDQRA